MNETTEENLKNEHHEKRRALLPKGTNIELEKFKRRLIRAVARMLLHEKRNEAEVWAGLKKETGCDCKELWNRMHALTIKKLHRLLDAQDRVDMLPKAARMSITDWLLFDMVLVHEDFDVIGMTETSKTDRKVLVDLFDLVEKFQIEFLAGDELADAWSAATLHYNRDNRECTPMLLQRRWYQLKLATRARFYKFWSMYKGVVKRLHLAESFKPTPLQTAIAKRYKPLVVKPFMVWDDLVTNKLVILPEEFDLKSKNLQPTAQVSSPDVLCLEPDVETIHLDKDSDSELEYRKPKRAEEMATISIKQEPKDSDETTVDESVPYENRQERISNFAQAVMVATALELDEMDYEDDISGFSESKLAEDVEMTLSEDRGILLEEDNDIPEAEFRETLNEKENNAVPDVQIISDDNKTPNAVVDQNENDAAPITTGDEKYDDEIQSIDDDLVIEENNIEMQKEPEQVLPLITSVFGGIDVSNENLSKIGMLTAQIANNVNKPVISKPEPAKSHNDDGPIELSSDSKEDSDDVEAVTENIPNTDSSTQIIKPELKLGVDIKPELSKTWFGELSNDIHFADDGIQLLDDGIEYQDDECAHQIAETNTEVDVKSQEPEDTGDEEDEDTPKIDKKLLMVPVVSSVKLDDMGILPLHLLEHVDNKFIIDIISFKSKPIKQELDIRSESCDEEEITRDIKKVKLSSVLLQKPRSRSYNPIQLCKNPDFNTRLKRLNVGFFSSSRNRLLLKACQPLTIDVSKAFESRLVNGTLYLKESTDSDLPKNIDLTESSQNVSVMPSAMAVQSLIDKEDLATVPAVQEASSQASERNKVINLPDISEIRRINQRLLTAQVTPLQLANNSSQVPVSIVAAPNTKPAYKYIAGPASRKRMMPKVVNITDAETIPNSTPNMIYNTEPMGTTRYKETWLPSEKAVPWKSRQIRPEIPWISNSYSIYSPDTLLALDTLNKMLYLLSEGNGNTDGEKRKKKKGKKKVPPLKAPPPTEDDHSDDVQVVGETKLDSAQAKNCREGKTDQSISTKKQKPVYCCWARQRICQMIFRKKRISNHKCPFPLCLCCCKAALIEFTKRQEERDTSKVKEVIKNESLESVEGRNAAKGNKIKATDVAEIIPIIKTNSSVPTSNCRPTSNPLPTVHIVQAPDSDSTVVNVDSGDRSVDLSTLTTVNVDDNISENRMTVVETADANNKATESELVLPSNELVEGEPVVSGNEAAEGEPVMCSEESTVDDVVISSNESIVGEKVCDELTLAEVVVCSDESNVSAAVDSRNKPTQLSEVTVGTNESTQNKKVERLIEIDCSSDDVSQGPEVSVVPQNCDCTQSVKSTIIVKAITTNSITTAMKPPPPPKKQRFRVKSSKSAVCRMGSMGVKKSEPRHFRGQPLASNPSEPIRVTVGQNKKVVVIDPTKLNRINSVSSLISDPRDKVQNTVVLDPTKASLVSNNYVNQKMIYLNSRQIAELPSDNPIFLGKNKILLTTAKFPPNFKAFEAFQRSIKQTLAIPKGIQLILQPNGRLTYIRDHKALITDEYLATLPHLIEAIQQQINSSVIAPITVQASSDSQNEVINLTEDDVDVIECIDKPSEDRIKTSIDYPTNTDNSTSAIAAVSLAPSIQTGNLEPIISINYSTVGNSNTSAEGNIQEPETTDSSIGKNTIISAGNNIQEHKSTDILISENANTPAEENIQAPKTSTNNLIGDNMNMPAEDTIEEPMKSTNHSVVVNTNTSTEGSIPALIKSTNNSTDDTSDMQAEESIQVSDKETVTTVNVEEDVEKTNTTEITLAHSEAGDQNIVTEVIEKKSMDSNKNTKNILSDLMAMSGIGPVDISPTFEESSSSEPTAQETLLGQEVQQIIQPPLLQPISSQFQQNSLLQINHTTKDTDKNGMLTHALTAITSLSELKYACSQNGAFFKLDLETGLLLPINVCMKNLHETYAARTRVPVRKLYRPPAPSRFILPAPKPVIDLTDDDITEVTEVTDLTEPRASNSLLKCNQPSYQNCNETSSDGEGTSKKSISPRDVGIVKPLKLFKSSVGRPYILERKLKEIQKRIKDAMTAQDEIRRKLKRKRELGMLRTDFGSSTDTSSAGDSDCSSDEEPLAKIATKMRAIENKKALSNKRVGEKLDVPVNEVSESEVIPIEDTEVIPIEDTKVIPIEDTEVIPIEDTVDAVDEHMDLAPGGFEEPMEDELDMSMEYLEEESLEEDDEEDNCILGV